MAGTDAMPCGDLARSNPSSRAGRPIAVVLAAIQLRQKTMNKQAERSTIQDDFSVSCRPMKRFDRKIRNSLLRSPGQGLLQLLTWL